MKVESGTVSGMTHHRSILVFVIVAFLGGTFAGEAWGAGDPSMNKRTRAYVDAAHACELGVGLVQLDIKKNVSLVALADITTQARDICEGVRSKLLSLDTSHFGDQASEVWYGVDRYKSGLNALLTYIDTSAPSKVIEVRNKFGEADAAITHGIKLINARRRLYGLGPLRR
jgi:hypothetical protein